MNSDEQEEMMFFVVNRMNSVKTLARWMGAVGKGGTEAVRCFLG